MNRVPVSEGEVEVVLGNVTRNDSIVRPKFLIDKDFGAVDHLVLYIVLILVLGISLSKTLSPKGSLSGSRDDVAASETTDEVDSSSGGIMRSILSAGGAMVSPFVNTLCLFGLTGEVYENGTCVMCFMGGVLLSLLFIYLLNYFPIMDDHNFTSFPSYLRKRFRKRGISYIVAVSSILRHLIGGALNLCAISVGVSAVTKVSAMLVAIAVSAISLFSSSVSRIHCGKNSSIGGSLIWLNGFVCFVTLCFATAKQESFDKFMNEAREVGSLTSPGLSPLPSEKNSLLGLILIGVFLGFQVFAFSRISLRYLNELPRRHFVGALAVCFVLMLLWTAIGLWSGICVAIASKDVVVLRPDGLLPNLVSKQMKTVHGFRGFFVSTLVAAALSGLTRRLNQLSELVWETIQDVFISEKSRQKSLAALIKRHAGELPEEFLRELKWKERKTTCFKDFLFKFSVGFVVTCLSCGIVYMFLAYRILIWELWMSVLGIFLGPIVAVLVLSFFCPCISSMSVCVGMLLGWVIPSVLMVGNKLSLAQRIESDAVVAQLKSDNESRSLGFRSSEIATLQNAFNLTFEKTTYVIFQDYEKHEEFQAKANKSRLLEAKPTDDKPDTPKRDKRFQRVTSTTTYAFYGFIGAVSSIVITVMFSLMTGKLGGSSSSPPASLLHPLIRRSWFGTQTLRRTPFGSVRGDWRDASHKRRRKTAMNNIQETANL